MLEVHLIWTKPGLKCRTLKLVIPRLIANRVYHHIIPRTSIFKSTRHCCNKYTSNMAAFTIFWQNDVTVTLCVRLKVTGENIHDSQCHTVNPNNESYTGSALCSLLRHSARKRGGRILQPGAHITRREIPKVLQCCCDSTHWYNEKLLTVRTSLTHNNNDNW